MAMALFKNFLDSLKLTEEDEEELDDEYDEYLVQQQEKERRKQEQRQMKQEQKAAQRRTRKEESYADRDAMFTSPQQREKEKPVKSSIGKVVPMNRKTGGFEVCIMKPEQFENSQDICDVLLSNRAVVINLEGYDVELAQRIMDFVSGAVYALDGNLQPISNYIFIISPGNINITGDDLDMMRQDGFEIPTFNKNF